MNLIYEVNLTVDGQVADEFLPWLRAHMSEMLIFEGFENAELLEEIGASDEAIHYCCQYRVRDQVALDHYLSHHADRMRADGVERFGSRFRARRRILTLR